MVWPIVLALGSPLAGLLLVQICKGYLDGAEGLRQARRSILLVTLPLGLGFGWLMSLSEAQVLQRFDNLVPVSMGRMQLVSEVIDLPEAQLTYPMSISLATPPFQVNEDQVIARVRITDPQGDIIEDRNWTYDLEVTTNANGSRRLRYGAGGPQEITPYLSGRYLVEIWLPDTFRGRASILIRKSI